MRAARLPENVRKLRVSCQSCSLAGLCLPHGLDGEALALLDKTIVRKLPLSRGQRLFSAGDPFDGIYAVRSGSAKVIYDTEGGDEQIMGFHLPGEILGLDGMENGFHTCSGVALETTTVCEFPYKKVEELCGHLPGLHRQMAHLIGSEIGREHHQLLLLARKDAPVRLAAFLLSMSDRQKRRGFSATEFNLSMSRHDIGNYLGLAVETVSRLFTRFQDLKLIHVERRLVQILKMEELGDMVDGCVGVHHANNESDRTVRAAAT